MPSAAARRARAPRWATLAEAAIYSRVPRSTLRRWIAQGRLPANRLGPRRIQVDLNDLDAMRQPIPTEQRPTLATGEPAALDSSGVLTQTQDDERVKSGQSEFERAGNG
jgi:excisionase family DNA binding protein